MRSQSTPVCSIPDCEKRVQARGLCGAHYYHALKATETRLCSVEGCDQPQRSRGMCNTHFGQFKRKGDPTFRAAPKPKQSCTVDGCDAQLLANGFCSLHYQRFKHTGTLIGSIRTESADDRFLTYSGSQGKIADECHIWTGGAASNGYGKLKVDGKTIGAHVYALRRTGVDIPDDGVARHRCPGGANKLCVNANHLLPGTQGDNIRDRDEDGTTVKGEQHHAARLTADDIRTIRVRRDAGETLQAIADDYGIAKQNVRAIALRQSWKHVV